MNNVSLIIPIFNEEENIDNLFNEIKNCKVYELVTSIIFVDDFSSDRSIDKLNFIKKLNSKVVILKHKKNYGQSKCLLTAINHTNAPIIITIDGDGQNNPLDIFKLLDLYLSDDSIYLVGGIRKKRMDNLIKIYSSKLANSFRKFILNDKCDDTGCSLKVFDRELFLKFPFFNGIHRFLPALFNGFGKNTKFINVSHRSRNFGKSKYGTISRLINGLIDTIRVLVIINNFRKKND